jgi:hypothetical protein
MTFVTSLSRLRTLGEVFRDPANKQQEEWRVRFENRITSPSFNSREAAAVYLSILTRGLRRPEYSADNNTQGA